MIAPPRSLVGLLVCALALPTLASAHELGVVQVQATFHPDATFTVDITTDPSHLEPGASAWRLGPAADQALLGFQDSDRAKIESFLGAFLSRARLDFDGLPAPSSVTFLRTEGALTARWTGAIPPEATEARWSTAMPIGVYPLTMRLAGNEAVRQWLTGGQASQAFSLRSATVRLPTTAVARQYLELGFTHILPKGLDHILFVLGIFLLSRKLRSVLLQVTAFTVAHTLTLGLSIFGILSLPAAIVEPLIALSIVYIAIENLLVSELRPWRMGLVFAFGLLHGLGFAGVLQEIGLPATQLVAALFSFNVGVELGQLAVIALAWALSWVVGRQHEWYRARVVVPASLAIAAVGLFWAWERTIGAS